MTFIIVVLSMAVLVLAYGRFQDRKALNELFRIRKDELEAIRMQNEFSPELLSRETAWELHRLANVELYLHMLKAMERALKREGFKITHSPTKGSEKLNEDASQRVARYIAAERCLFIAPTEPAEIREDRVTIGERDGYNFQLLHILSKGCASQGWYLERSDDE
ncbi:hypothetical protein AM391_RS21355 [Kluyvera ascorbata]|nr:hypothetical protein [Kluyvera ascorbata]